MPRWPYHHPASDRSDCICFERNGRSPGNRVHSKGLFWTGGQPHELSKYPRNGRRREVVGVAIFYDGGQSPRTGRTARVCREKSRGIPIIVSPPNRKRRSFTWIPLA